MVLHLGIVGNQNPLCRSLLRGLIIRQLSDNRTGDAASEPLVENPPGPTPSMIRRVWIDYNPPTKPVVAKREVFQIPAPSCVYQFPASASIQKPMALCGKRGNPTSALILSSPEERFLLDSKRDRLGQPSAPNASSKASIPVGGLLLFADEPQALFPRG
jgi:hypothetical protein